MARIRRERPKLANNISLEVSIGPRANVDKVLEWDCTLRCLDQPVFAMAGSQDRHWPTMEAEAERIGLSSSQGTEIGEKRDSKTRETVTAWAESIGDRRQEIGTRETKA